MAGQSIPTSGDAASGAESTDQGATRPPSRPIFFDPSGRRSRWLNAVVISLALCLVAALTVWVGLATSDPLAARKVAGTDPGAEAAAARPTGAAPATKPLPATPETLRVGAFYVPWDDDSRVSLEKNIGFLDSVTAEWWHLDDQGQVADSAGENGPRLLELVQKTRRGPKVFPLVNNFDSRTQRWRGDRVASLIADPARRSALATSLVEHVKAGHFPGLNVDFEALPEDTGSDFVAFVKELADGLHAVGATLVVDAPADDESFPFAGVGEAADKVLLMMYDEHYTGSGPGSVAGQPWLETALAQRVTEIPPAKITLALGGYGYDWNTSTDRGEEVSFQEAMALARAVGAVPRSDPSTLNLSFGYTAKNGQVHQVWFLDAVTAFNSAQVARSLGIRDVAVWRLGTEDPTTWQALRLTGADVAERLTDITADYGMQYQGEGELITVVSTPAAGRRVMTWDAARDRITAAEYVSLPRRYTIQRSGATSDKAVALTFDDGPDPAFTAAILDTLDEKDVTATFFVIGAHTITQGDLVRRAVAEGHELGIHTFTHPDLSRVSHLQFDLELNLSQHLLASTTGRHSILFRPPFAEDIEPTRPDEISIVARASAAGYHTVGMHVDPKDFTQPGVQQIVDATLEQVANGDGQIILLHDSGGLRQQTLEALPLIIDELREQGYTFTTVSELAGIPRDVANPPVDSPERSRTIAAGVGFDALGSWSSILSVLFAVGIVLATARLVVIAVSALVSRQKEKHTAAIPMESLPSMTAVVPAFNEAKVVNATVETLLRSDLPGLRVRVIDDGSTDGTAATVLNRYGDHPRVTVQVLPNGGKARALNAALLHVDTDLLMVIDADTQVMPQAARLLAAHFADPRVAAVAGNAKVGNRTNLLTRWQAIEYITSQNVERRALALVNAIGVVPGAIGAWRTSVLRELGGFQSDTLAEDADLTLRVLRAGHRVEYEMGAVAYTEAPETLRAFLRQRDRWSFGTLQASWKQHDLLTSRTPGNWQLRLVTLPNVAVFQLLVPIIGLVLDLNWVLSIGWAWGQQTAHRDVDFMPGGPLVVLGLALMLMDVFAAMVAFALEPGEDWRMLPLIVPQRIAYRPLLSYVAIRAVASALKGKHLGWNKLVRKGSVRIATSPRSGSALALPGPVPVHQG